MLTRINFSTITRIRQGHPLKSAFSTRDRYRFASSRNTLHTSHHCLLNLKDLKLFQSHSQQASGIATPESHTHSIKCFNYTLPS